MMMMKKYDVWYMRPEFFPKGILGVEFITQRGRLPDPLDLAGTHVYLVEREAHSLDDLFLKMQGESWSPNGEANPLIRDKGLRHTSMSVGDVAVEKGGAAWICDNFGWVELPTEWVS